MFFLLRLRYLAIIKVSPSRAKRCILKGTGWTDRHLHTRVVGCTLQGWVLADSHQLWGLIVKQSGVHEPVMKPSAG